MGRLLRLAVAGLLCGGALGCTSSRVHVVSSRPLNQTDGGVESAPASLPSIGQPTRIELASLKLPSHEAVAKALAGPAEVSGYRLLVESQCQCLAASESALANLFSGERQSVVAGAGGRRDRDGQARGVLSEILALRAIEERNQSATSAMELFYRLAAAYFGRTQLDRSLEEVRRSIRDFRKAKDTGLSVPGDEAKLVTQEIELVDRRVQLESAIAQMDEQLCQLLRLDRDPSQPLWPGADMTVGVEPIDVEAAVAEGLSSRPDLAMLEVLRDNLNEQTLRVARSALARIDPLMGIPGPKKHMVCTALNRCRISLETEARQVQLDELWELQRRRAEDEIRRAAAEVATRLRRVGLAKDKLDQCEGLLARLRQRREAKGTVQVSEISAAQAEVFRAENDAFQAIAEWKIALVKLKQSQGLLAAECGYGKDEG